MLSFNVSKGLELLLGSIGVSKNIVLSEEEYQILKKTGIFTKKFSVSSLDDKTLNVIINIYFPEEDSEEFVRDNDGNYIVPEESLGSPFLELEDEDEDDEDWE